MVEQRNDHSKWIVDFLGGNCKIGGTATPKHLRGQDQPKVIYIVLETNGPIGDDIDCAFVYTYSIAHTHSKK